MHERGILFVLTGPSGVGKGTVLKEVRGQRELYLSISATTRQPRPGEQDGVHYFFLTREQFEKKVAENGFLEHAEFSGNCYGTPAAPVDAQLDAGHDVLLEIEVQGAMQVHQKRPDAVRIFIAPPSFDELERRLVGRGTEQPEVVRRRLETARHELTMAEQFDYIVVNNTVEQAAADVLAILRAEKCRAARVQVK
ncbi:MAG TPA: guanylate kinase [Candidatus Butyricicoccus stercorigallinarum]|nr:guanylate kinase [Candidatus Butyricicoccus stercorigallinarum]